MRKHSHGFTLIELLVVIAIIAILAAILFPVFSMAKATGYRASCMANLRSIGRALELYRDNNNSSNCSIWQARGYGAGHNSWHFAIIPYLGQKVGRTQTGENNANSGRKTVYNCPAAGWLVGKAVPLTDSDANKPQAFSYEMNETYWTSGTSPACGGGWGQSGVGQVDSMFKRPSQTIFIAEGMGYSYMGIGYANDEIVNSEDPANLRLKSSGTKAPAPDEDIPLCDPNRIGLHGGSWSKMYNIRVSHSGKANLMFYDGHVECRSKTKGKNWITR